MGTSYETIFEPFLEFVDSLDMARLNDEQMKSLLITFLKRTTALDFKACRKNLSLTENGIIDILDDEEIQIIVLGMRLAYLEKEIFRAENLKMGLSTADLKRNSSANMLDKLTALKLITQADLESYIENYNYDGFEGF